MARFFIESAEFYMNINKSQECLISRQYPRVFNLNFYYNIFKMTWNFYEGTSIVYNEYMFYVEMQANSSKCHAIHAINIEAYTPTRGKCLYYMLILVGMRNVFKYFLVHWSNPIIFNMMRHMHLGLFPICGSFYSNKKSSSSGMANRIWDESRHFIVIGSKQNQRNKRVWSISVQPIFRHIMNSLAINNNKVECRLRCTFCSWI